VVHVMWTVLCASRADVEPFTWVGKSS
jgi:hypothetical protein